MQGNKSAINTSYLLGFLLLGTVTLLAQEPARQSLALTDAYVLLEERYPLLRNGELIQQLEQQQHAQLKTDAMPSLYWKTDARLQSESVQLDPPEGSNFPLAISRPLVNAQSYLEGQYILLDGGVREARGTIISAETAVQQQQLQVERYQLRQQVNELFLGLSALRAQAGLFELSLNDIDSRIDQARAGVENGVLLESELTKLLVRRKQMATEQNNVSLQIEGILNSLEDLLAVELAEDVELQYPSLPAVQAIPGIDRPEQNLFRLQQNALLAQEALIDTDKRPKLNLFAQAGIGYPNPLNLLDSDPAPYAIVGAGLSWKLIDWDKAKQQKETLRLRALQVQNQQASFEFRLEQAEARYLANVKQLVAQIESDQEIAELQGEILQQSAAQLEEGVITTAEYLSQSTAELQARQQLKLHEVQLLQLQLNFWNSRGGGEKNSQ